MGKKADKRRRQDAERAAKMARTAARLARRTSAVERAEEVRAQRLAWRQAEAGVLALTDEPDAPALAPGWQPRRALLIINTKSGPNHDSILHVRDLVALLGQVGIQADVRVKLRKAQARKEARAAAKSGYPLVIAAGGDGTVGAIARGLVGTRAALGIIPLGTYNNVATSLGIPRDVPAACALIASGTPRAIDVAQAEVQGRKKPRIYLEAATVGLGAALTPVGQDVEKGRWAQAAETLPLALEMRPTTALVQLDKAPPGQVAYTLLVTVANAPRAGAGLRLAPDARLDDGLLDVAVYHDMDQAALALRVQAIKNGTVAQDERVRTARGRSVEVRTAHPMPVSADSKLIGVTPARFRVLTGALLAVTGQGDGLLRPGSSSLASFSATAGRALAAQAESADQARTTPAVHVPTPLSPVTTSVQALVPVVGRTLDGLGGARAVATPALSAAAGALALALVRRLLGR